MNKRVIFEKSRNDNSVNCWKTLIVQKTTAWLEMTGAKVIKISEIGQSASKLLFRKDEEGSETNSAEHLNLEEKGDDIVQTTTVELLDCESNSGKKIP